MSGIGELYVNAPGTWANICVWGTADDLQDSLVSNVRGGGVGCPVNTFVRFAEPSEPGCWSVVWICGVGDEKYRRAKSKRTTMKHSRRVGAPYLETILHCNWRMECLTAGMAEQECAALFLE